MKYNERKYQILNAVSKNWLTAREIAEKVKGEKNVEECMNKIQKRLTQLCHKYDHPYLLHRKANGKALKYMISVKGRKTLKALKKRKKRNKNLKLPRKFLR